MCSVGLPYIVVTMMEPTNSLHRRHKLLVYEVAGGLRIAINHFPLYRHTFVINWDVIIRVVKLRFAFIFCICSQSVADRGVMIQWVDWMAQVVSALKPHYNGL